MKPNHVHHQTHLEKPLPPAPDPPTSVQPLQQWRQQALLNLLRVALVLALPALALDSYNAVQQQEIIPTILYAIGYVVLVGLVAVPRVPNLVRVLYLISLLYLIGATELLSHGIVVGGMLFMLTFVVVASLFLDVRGALITGSIALVTVVGTIMTTEQVRALTVQITDLALLVLLTSMIVSLTLTLTHTLLASLRRAEDLAAEAQHALHQAFHDALTGLYNRRYLDDLLPNAIQHAHATHTPVSVLILDVDHFKQFNDTYGHAAGDALLRAMGVVLASNTAEQDTACQWGGEEFVVVLPGLDVERAVERAEQLREAVQQLALMYNGQPLGTITVSIGIATFPVHGKQDLLQAADAALYAAKRNGRNQVVVAGNVPIFVPARRTGVAVTP